MRITRVFHDADLPLGETIVLNPSASHHLCAVLRLPAQSPVTVFNGRCDTTSGAEYRGTLTHCDNRACHVLLQEELRHPIPKLASHLGQCIARGEKMDFIIQKAVELGVTAITPLFSRRCGVKLQGQRLQKRQQHWRQVAIAAAEQCGRVHIPELHPAQDLLTWLEQAHNPLLILQPEATQHLFDLRAAYTTLSQLSLLIGPEGGFSDQEITAAHAKPTAFPLRLGPRVLRTETAALATLASLQSLFGDFL